MFKSFPFTSWVYRDITVYPPTELDNQVECGLSVPMTPPANCNDPEHLAILIKYLERASELGIQLILHTTYTNTTYGELGEEEYCRQLKELYEVKLNSHPAIYGFFVGDEPSTVKDLENTKGCIIAMKKTLPHLIPYINMQGASGSYPESYFGGMSHVAWLKSIIDEVGYFMISYDMYGQLVNDGGGTTDYFYESKKVMDICEEVGIQPWACLICSGHEVFHKPDEYDIMWQITTAAAMGFAGINWFRFYDSPAVPNYHGSPIDQFGYKTTHFYDMLRCIRGFGQQMGEVFPYLKRKATYFFGEDRDRQSYGRFDATCHDVIEEIRGSFEEAMVSFFEHTETGEEYFCIVNCSRKFYNHFEIRTKNDDYDVYMIFQNGLREGKRPLLNNMGENFQGDFLYPGQMNLYKIKKK